ncbi:MAG: ATP-binding cassette domain-containing protein [Candidatus Bathyarchaeota archaeon]|nr:ATP-binding cassette domain-containing protein [Candidatus Bathyarchaeota archaeon]
MVSVAIKAENLTKRYGDLVAVDHINFEVQKGEIFGFLGPNGAGKSTTTRMLIGISIPTEGTAQVMGFDIRRQSVRAKELMGIVTDVSNVYTQLTAWQNLIFTGKLYDIPKSERESRAKELLQLFGLFERRNDNVEGFSKGMRRRLCIAMALMNKSSILFLDEPTVGLDVQSSLIIRNLVKKLNSEGLTVFVTTHNMEEANQMCDRVAIINNGKIEAIDTPEMLKSAIKKLQVIEVSFVGSNGDLTSELKKIQEVTDVTKNGDKYRLNTENVPQALSNVWGFSKKKGLTINTLNTLSPTLEDVFVELTGIQPEIRPPKTQRGQD